MVDKFQLDLEAQQSLTKLYEQAQVTRDLFRRAGQAMPERLRLFLGMNSNGTQESSNVKSPPRPRAPKEANEDWIFVPVKDAMAQSVMLGILKDNPRPMKPKEIIEAFRRFDPDINVNVVYNMGPRLKGKSIETSDDGWVLVKRDEAPIIVGDYIWGLPKFLALQDIAEHRRNGILHILKFFDTGLELLQITEQLRKAPWIKATVNKDLVKADISELLKADKIRRRGNTKKYELVKAE